ncbi:hypothetical protein RHMOL_Rhmol01G0013400 [Rhododendron molle]|uniref:Uncharacterized protein n=1 Tax=Rhododendron molle TaxID=49168 RepID=A0ACC0PXH2_RHOML|nr:hypothetical protein RHMOL_Rhmol01G0013400 [Rhododendron molle]
MGLTHDGFGRVDSDKIGPAWKNPFDLLGAYSFCNHSTTTNTLTNINPNLLIFTLKSTHSTPLV